MPSEKDEKKKDRSKRGGRSTDRKDDRGSRSNSARGGRGMNRAASLRSMRSSGDGGGGSSMARSGSARSLRDKERREETGGNSSSKKKGDSDQRRGSQSERTTSSRTSSKTPLERQTSNNEDSMAMLLGLAGKKKPRRRTSDSDSSSSSSSTSSRGSRGGPPITGEKAKHKTPKAGPLLNRARATSDNEAPEDGGLALDLSHRSNRSKGRDDSSFTTGQSRGDDVSRASMTLNMSKLAFPTVESTRKASQAEKNTFVSRPDLRKVDQSVNLMDIEAAGRGKGGRPGMKESSGDFSTTSFTSNSSSAYSRNSFSRNKKNPYLKVSPWENFMYSIKDSCRNLCSALCNHKVCLLAAVFVVVLLLAILVPVLLNKKVIKSSELLVPMRNSNDGMVHPVIDTIEKEGITYLVPVVGREKAQERLETFQMILVEHRMDTTQEDKYAKEGLKWIAEYDPAQLPLESDEGAILQRYALAVFFFATHPGTTANRTTDQALMSGSSTSTSSDEPATITSREQDERRIDSYGANWMLHENICSWQGIECQDDNRVVHLNMSGTTLQGTLPAELALLKELSVVDLSHNYLEGQLPEILMERLSKLRYLLLQDNLLTGFLSDKLGEWDSLTYLNLAQNKFSGHLPRTLEELTELELLFLQENLLSGSIPNMKGMKALEYLYMNNNDFTGQLPRDLFKDKALVDVRLEYNSLTGSLPDEVHKLHGLEVLSVGNNDLNGTIPDVFHHTKNLIALDLHKNEFSGSLPASLGHLTKLEHLLLDHNRLTGAIAPDWFEMGKLRTLVLHHNKLEGDIPSTISGLTNLHDLWLNHNAFVGTIPPELSECSSLVNVYLHDNEFTGTVPSNFHELEHLGTLRLYHNKLKGDISEDFCGLKEHFSLSYIAADCVSEVECSCCDKCY